MIDEKPIKNKEISHVVWPAPLEGPSGGYPVQPAAAAPESKKNPVNIIKPAGGTSQKEYIFSLGNAISSVPIIRGIQKLPNMPTASGIIT